MKSLYQKIYDSDVGHSFLTSPTAILAAVIAFVCIFCALFAPWVAPHNPFNLASLELANARLPPAWSAGGNLSFPLGTDDQGRDILSALIFGARISLIVGLASVFLSVIFGVSLGLLAGFLGGWVDSLLMRMCDIMLSFPAILIALLIAGAMNDACHKQHADFLLVTGVPALHESATAMKIPSLDVSAAQSNDRFALPDGLQHLNYAGNGVIAWEIARALDERQLVSLKRRDHKKP